MRVDLGCSCAAFTYHSINIPLKIISDSAIYCRLLNYLINSYTEKKTHQTIIIFRFARKKWLKIVDLWKQLFVSIAHRVNQTTYRAKQNKNHNEALYQSIVTRGRNRNNLMWTIMTVFLSRCVGCCAVCNVSSS